MTPEYFTFLDSLAKSRIGGDTLGLVDRFVGKINPIWAGGGGGNSLISTMWVTHLNHGETSGLTAAPVPDPNGPVC